MSVRRSQDPNNLVWIDLEMTGLDSSHDVIVQAALIVTNRELEPLEEYVCDIWQPDEELRKMTPFVEAMHEANGLVARVRDSQVDIGAAERNLLERVAGWCPYGAVLCGNSVGHDKRFLEAYTPGLARYLSYRIVDVTSLKILCKLWYGEGAAFPKPTKGAHDALVDIKNSIAELRHYQQVMLRPRG